MQFILQNTFGSSACHSNHAKRRVFRQADFDFARKLFPGMKSLAGHNLLDPLSLQVPQPFHMTFLREPVARVFSHYQESVLNAGNRLSFEESLQRHEYLENLHVKLMAGERNLDKAKRYLERCDFVGLTEKFNLSLHALDKLSPYPLDLRYKRLRTAPTNCHRQPLTEDPRMIELARKHNQLDLKLYDFAITEIFPKICAKAGFKVDDEVASYDCYASKWHWRYRWGNFYNLAVYRQCGKLKSRS